MRARAVARCRGSWPATRAGKALDLGHAVPQRGRIVGVGELLEIVAQVACCFVVAPHFGQHQTSNLGQGHERTYDTKPYEYGDPFQLDLNRTIRNALARSCGGTPIQLDPADF